MPFYNEDDGMFTDPAELVGKYPDVEHHSDAMRRIFDADPDRDEMYDGDRSKLDDMPTASTDTLNVWQVDNYEYAIQGNAAALRALAQQLLAAADTQPGTTTLIDVLNTNGDMLGLHLVHAHDE